MQLLTAARYAGALAGTGVALLGIDSWQIARGDQTPPTVLTVQVGPIGELAVNPVGKILAVGRMRVGAEHPARFTMRNQTGSELRIRLSGTGTERGLDSAVRTVVTVDGGRMATGTLGDLRRGVSLGRLRAGREREVVVTTSLERAAPGVVADVKLALKATPVR